MQLIKYPALFLQNSATHKLRNGEVKVIGKFKVRKLDSSIVSLMLTGK